MIFYRLAMLALLETVAAQRPPFLNLTLTPNFQGPNITTLGVRLSIEQPRVNANQTLLTFALDDASTPRRNATDVLAASDASGPLPLTQADDDEGAIRSFNVTRPTDGDVVIMFTAKPNLEPDFSPILGYRVEADGLGLLGAGLSFLPLPTGPEYTLNLVWDLALTPAGTRGVSSFGENTVTRVGSSNLLGDCFFAVGQVQCFGTQSNFSMYWFGEHPTLNLTQTAIWTEQLYRNMRQFFNDTGDSYRVFVRKGPNSYGGASLTRSFLLYYSPDASHSLIENTLAHEMVHNWPSMTGSIGETNWYLEGVADYYSARLPFRFRIHTPDRFVDEMNSFARTYYSNPYVNITNKEQDQQSFDTIPWQNLAYGRGNLFLVRMDTEIRAKSNGTRSIDNVVLALLDRTRNGQGDGVEDFISLLVQELGPQGRQEYDDMANGKPLVMQENSLGPCY